MKAVVAQAAAEVKAETPMKLTDATRRVFAVPQRLLLSAVVPWVSVRSVVFRPHIYCVCEFVRGVSAAIWEHSKQRILQCGTECFMLVSDGVSTADPVFFFPAWSELAVRQVVNGSVRSGQPVETPLLIVRIILCSCVLCASMWSLPASSRFSTCGCTRVCACVRTSIERNWM